MGWLDVALVSLALGVISFVVTHGALPHLLRGIAILPLIVALIGKLLGWARWAEAAVALPIAAFLTLAGAILAKAFLVRKR